MCPDEEQTQTKVAERNKKIVEQHFDVVKEPEIESSESEDDAEVESDNELQVPVSYFVVKLAGKQQKLIVSNERENTSKGTKLVRKIPVLG